MKKFLSVILLSLYLVSSIGVTVSAHYCGGNLASFAFFDKDLSCCCDDEATGKTDDCCKDESKSIKITADQNKVEFNEKQHALVDLEIIPAPRCCFFTKSALVIISSLPFCVPDPPDKGNLIAAYKRNHSFLFYS